MPLSLIQFRDAEGVRGVASFDNDPIPRRILGAESVLDLAGIAVEAGLSLAQTVRDRVGEPIWLPEVELLLPIEHPDPAHVFVTGTGLTHLGSAEGRDKMHRAAKEDPRPTDSMKMFLMGLEGGKPAAGSVGVQPEWFYKGNGDILVAPDAPIRYPSFAQDAGEEPELAGIYLIGPDGTPLRLGFCLGNEFSDHVTERENYLWLAHSKLRQAALGPELVLGDAPQNLQGVSRIRRDGQVLWEKPFLSGEQNMSHTIANLEHHHFKYPIFRRPGDIHVHFFGTATLSFSDGVATRPGDVFEIEARPFRLPVRNPIERETEAAIAIKVL